ncbi:transglycosylase SLT domain-containing protein [Streptomyces avicenniae]|uniref:transglycosylase SLT domain-containing protein n=1 Tax=Streptomyces avicenniae TaxID=500153 RepID=UPI00069A3845|nr:transglycosylase SLT domain-containing protein [Streptomyces avicenniae]
MTATRTTGTRRTWNRKASLAGVVTAGAAALTVALVPAHASAAESAARVATQTDAPMAFLSAAPGENATTVSDTLGGQQHLLDIAPERSPAAKTPETVAATAPETQPESAPEAAPEAQPEAAPESAPEAEAKAAPESKPAEVTYPDNLDGWIREAMAIMKEHGIPGSYEGIHRNIIRESSGDPNAINNWDINAQNGVPSKGLLQVIQPTFDRYHVEGTPYDLYDPVANIVAACNYAADRYGSMDNVNSAY